MAHQGSLLKIAGDFFLQCLLDWRISEEHFFDPLKDAIDNLKIRASYGSLGNQDLKDYYPYASVLALDASYWFGDSKNYTTGIYSNALSNLKSLGRNHSSLILDWILPLLIPVWM